MELDIKDLVQNTEKTLKRNATILCNLFLLCFLILIGLILSRPTVPNQDPSIFTTLPMSSDSLRKLAEAVEAYRDQSYEYTLGLFCFLYLYLQSFGIPGPIFLSQISGVIFGKWIGLFIVTICSTIGSTLCYVLSNNLGKGIVVRLFPDMLVKTNRIIVDNKDNLLNYLLFLRVMPIVPNWIINLAAPIIGVPLHKFVVATLFGLIPPNFIYATGGITLKTINEQGADYYSLGVLVVIGVLVVVPALRKKEVKVKV
jgi:uncharacterized membrane protein YdjX (TVP38/TMEM64 family)